jgi:lauroyl/myristoyl acyltransferase
MGPYRRLLRTRENPASMPRHSLAARAPGKAALGSIVAELRACGIQGAAFVVRRAPRSLAYGLAQGTGGLVYRIWGAKRRAALVAMRHVLGPTTPERELICYARASFGYYACAIVDLLAGPDRTAGADGPAGACARELAMQARGRGLILVGAHQGSWDRAAMALYEQGLPLAVIANPIVPPRLHRWLAALRRQYGVTMVSPTPAGMRLACRVLAANGIVGVLIDQAEPINGVCVTMFGAPVRLPTGPARLALYTGASLAVGGCIRAPDQGHFRLIAGPPIATAVDPETDPRGPVAAITQALATALEALIRQDPAQWYVFHPFWLDSAGPP